jgi:hypothetical protein
MKKVIILFEKLLRIHIHTKNGTLSKIITKINNDDLPLQKSKHFRLRSVKDTFRLCKPL